MNISDLAAKYEITENVATEYVIANGFSVDKNAQYDAKQIYLVGLYGEYQEALDDAKQARQGFRYQDGEEMVDKSSVYDSYRRHANDLYARWKAELDAYNREHASGSYFIVRKRARHLDV